VPDLPGCIAAADTRAEVDELIRDAVVGHVEMVRQYGEEVPEPQASTGLVEV
jgi:predicted RNase H-like HicB family nuclease